MWKTTRICAILNVLIPYGVDNLFHFIIPLKHLFEMFNKYNRITGGNDFIRIVRTRTDNECMQIVADNTSPKVTVGNIEPKVILVFPSDDIKLNLLQASPITIYEMGTRLTFIWEYNLFTEFAVCGFSIKKTAIDIICHFNVVSKICLLAFAISTLFQ